MIRHWLIRFGLVATLLVGCGKKNADDVETKPPAKAETEKDTVTLSEESRKASGIEAITVTRSNRTVALRVPGRITFDQNHTAKVGPTMEGRILKMNFDIGAPIKQGEVMALIDSPELLKPLELKAPIDGMVVERLGAVGEMLDKAKEFYTISDLRTVWCIAAINEKDSATVHAGQAAAVRVLAYPEESFRGVVVLPGQAVNETTRTLEARIEVDNSSGKLKSGMFATVSLATEKLENRLIIPDAAVQNVRGLTCVFIEGPPGKFHLTVVRLGERIDGQDEVLDGLNDGARVVTAGSFVLKSELLKASMEEP